MPSTVTCATPSHTLTSAQADDQDVLLLADATTVMHVPANAVPGTGWLCLVGTADPVTVRVAGDAGSINGVAGGVATTWGAGSVVGILVQANSGSPSGVAPVVRVIGDVMGERIAAEINRADELYTFTAADAGAESVFSWTAEAVWTLPADLPARWRHTVWNRSAANTVTLVGAAGVSVNGVSEGAVAVGPKANATIACHGSDIISITRQSFAVVTPTQPWLPSDVANLTLWLEADGNGTLRDAGGTTVGDLPTIYVGKTPPVYITQWDDASNGARHFSQATAVDQPGYVQATFGGYGGLNFPSAASTLRLNGPTRSGMWSGQEFTVAAVVRVTQVNTNNTSTYESNDGIISDGWSGLHLRGPSGGPYKLFGYAYDTAYRIVDQTVMLNTAYVAVLCASGGTMRLSLNGGTPASVSLPGAIGGAGTTQIGTKAGADIGAVLTWSADIGDTEAANLVAYLAAKAGITL